LLFIGLAGRCHWFHFIFRYFGGLKDRQLTATKRRATGENTRITCKFITIREGDFAEIYHYETIKDKISKQCLGKKKPLSYQYKTHSKFYYANSNGWRWQKKTSLTDPFPTTTGDDYVDFQILR
jgi:hypothetical protein